MTDFIHSTVTEADADGVIVSLSGGLDSTVSATLASIALHADDVEGVILPTSSNTEHNMADARRIAEDLGIRYTEYDMQPLVDTFRSTVATEQRLVKDHPLGSETRRITLAPRSRPDYRESMGNVMARLRMIVAYFEANTTNRLVLGTGNRTELLLGYFTKYGDGGVDLLPLGSLYKTEVQDVARHLGIPDRIIEKEPTAGLWNGQTDEDELGSTYGVIDTVLSATIDGEMTPDSIAERMDIPMETITSILDRVEDSDHKRVPPPRPGSPKRVVLDETD